MTAPLRNALYLFVTVMAIATAACQPAEDPAGPAGPQIDPTAQKADAPIDRVGDKGKNTAENTKEE